MSEDTIDGLVEDMTEDALESLVHWCIRHRAALASLRAGTHVVVPREPTQAMLDAAFPASTAWGVWRLMLAASEAPHDAPVLAREEGAALWTPEHRAKMAKAAGEILDEWKKEAPRDE